jgi:hypothetical protein
VAQAMQDLCWAECIEHLKLREYNESEMHYDGW